MPETQLAIKRDKIRDVEVWEGALWRPSQHNTNAMTSYVYLLLPTPPSWFLWRPKRTLINQRDFNIEFYVFIRIVARSTIVVTPQEVDPVERARSRTQLRDVSPEHVSSKVSFVLLSDFCYSSTIVVSMRNSFMQPSLPTRNVINKGICRYHIMCWFWLTCQHEAMSRWRYFYGQLATQTWSRVFMRSYHQIIHSLFTFTAWEFSCRNPQCNG